MKFALVVVSVLLSLPAEAGKGGGPEVVVEIGGGDGMYPALGGKGGKGGKGSFLHAIKKQTERQEHGLQQREQQLELTEKKIEAREKPIEKALEGAHAGESKSDADQLLQKEKRLVKKESGVEKMVDMARKQAQFMAAREHGIGNAIVQQKAAMQSMPAQYGGKGGPGNLLHMMQGQIKGQEHAVRIQEQKLEQKQKEIEAREKPVEEALEGNTPDADQLLQKEKQLVKKESGVDATKVMIRNQEQFMASREHGIDQAIARQKVARKGFLKMRDHQLHQAEKSMDHRLDKLKDETNQLGGKVRQVEQQLHAARADNQTRKAHRLEHRDNNLLDKEHHKTQMQQLLRNRKRVVEAKKRVVEAQEHGIEATMNTSSSSRGHDQKSAVDHQKHRLLTNAEDEIKAQQYIKSHPAHEAHKQAPQPSKSSTTKPAATQVQQHKTPSPSASSKIAGQGSPSQSLHKTLSKKDSPIYKSALGIVLLIIVAASCAGLAWVCLLRAKVWASDTPQL